MEELEVHLKHKQLSTTYVTILYSSFIILSPQPFDSSASPQVLMGPCVSVGHFIVIQSQAS